MEENQHEEEELTQTIEQDPLHQLMEEWPALSTSDRRDRFAALPRTEAEELFLNLKAPDQAELLIEASALERRSWVRMLAPDDVADLIQEIGIENRNEILPLLDSGSRREVRALLAYAEDIAGGLMSSRFVRLRPDMTVDEAISYLRIQSRTQVETIYYAYVIDTDMTLLGVVSFRELFAAASSKNVNDIMKTDVAKISVDTDQEEIAKIFTQYDYMALPVIDEMGHMKGIVTFDDIAGVAEQEATEDMHKLAAIESLDAPYLQISIFEMFKKRAIWLLVLFVGEMFTANAIHAFQNEIEKAVVLTLFIPLIIASGGNSGSQASTLIIRAMALGEVRLKDWMRVFVRELMTSSSIGLLLALVGFLRVVLWPDQVSVYGEHYIAIGLSVGVSLIGVVIWGSLVGSMLPFVLRICKLDPATASAPFVATLVDVTGLMLYFSVASYFLLGKLL